jgi:large subunit ribosomal protein L7/L12
MRLDSKTKRRKIRKEDMKMAKISTKDIIESLKEMTILEVKELVDAMKDEFGVDPSAVAVAAAPIAAEEEESSTKTVVLKDAGASKISVIKIVRDVTGLGLIEAKALADNGGNIKENVSVEEANELKAKLEEAGATVELA